MSGLGPKDSSWTVTPEMEEAIKNANAEEIKEIFRAQAVAQGLATQEDSFHPEILTPSELSTHAKTRSKTVTVNGETFEISGSTDEELVAKELQLFRELIHPQEQPTVQAQRDPQNGRFISAEQQAANAELELRFKRGEISTDDYLTQSGAIERHLEAQGIDVNSLREVSGRGFVQSWASATEKFLHSAEGESWPSGEANLKIVAEILETNNLLDAEDKQAAIAAAVNFAREHDMLVSNPATESANAISRADNHEDIRALGRRALGQPASGYFER